MRQIDRGRYRILCGVDFNRASDHAIREAHQLAQRIGHSELHFVHALDASLLSQTASETEGLLDAAAARLEAYVRRVLSLTGLGSLSFVGVFHVRCESPLRALIGVANQERVDLIMVGANERGGLSQLWHRSALHSLMKEAPAPVLVAHPRKHLGRSEAVAEQGAEHGSGVYAAVARTSEIPPPPAMDGDSTSSLCLLHEMRATRPSDISGLKPAAAPRLNTGS